MAVTIHSSPQAFTPSDNPITWTFSSNQTAQPNFSYIVEIYINGVLDSRNRVFPRAGARAHIDVSEAVSRYVQPPVTDQTTVVSFQENHLPVYIVVRERYGATPAYQASATSGTIRAFKASLTNEGFVGFNYTDYYLFLSNPSKFLTDSPNIIEIKRGGSYFLSILADNADSYEANFELFDENGSTITGADIAIVQTETYNFIQLNFKPSFLIAETLGVVTQTDFDNAAYMEMWITSGGGDPITEVKRVYFVNGDCGANVHCVWLNRFGGFDCYTFTHNRIDSSNVESGAYEKQFGEWQGNNFVYDPNNSGVVQYTKTTRNKAQLVSGWIQQTEQQYLCRSMYNSVLCFIEETDFQRVTIEQTQYELQNDRFEEEFTEIVDIALPNIDKSVVL